MISDTVVRLRGIIRPQVVDKQQAECGANPRRHLRALVPYFPPHVWLVGWLLGFNVTVS